MHSKFDPALFASHSSPASLMSICRFLKRNRLTVRGITRKGRKKLLRTFFHTLSYEPWKKIEY
ncbi:Hypothetical protein PHPALM_918 [Phytophthora palmivora]|uniref:Uncharacterized protein n=1 Tax=Phytophthora palmivora TaxID=4796 RepID=A0A2P4YTM3_9STRA|nr:Hypothetical protein PHPALM_918 [Phytophthora palmivora]